MAIHLQKELGVLKDELLALGIVVEETVDSAVRALKSLDRNLAQKVIESDNIIDLKEIEVEEECLKILALYQPVAIDLRFVVSALKINNDLERVGDLAVNIAERVRFLCEEDQVEIPFAYDKMVTTTKSMLKKAMESLVKFDLKMANEVCLEDDTVDAINRQMYETVYQRIREQPQHVEALIHYLTISRHLERIADYATNIAEDVIYMIEGTIVRHHPEMFHHPKNPQT